MAEEGGWRPKVVSERHHRWRWQKKVDGDLKLSGRDSTGGDGRRRWMET